MSSNIQSTCPPPPTPTPTQMTNQLAEAMSRMNIPACTTKTSKFETGYSAAASMDSVILSASANMEAHLSYNESNSTGCENIAIATNSIRDVTNQIACTIDSSKNTSATNVHIFNKITIGPTANITCKNLNIGQSINANISIVKSLSDTQAKQLAQAIQTAAANTVRAAQTVSTGEAATATGANRSFQQAQTDIMSNSTTQNISNKINEMLSEISSGNEIIISGNVTGETCNITQANVVQLKSEEIMNSVMDMVMSMGSVSQALASADTTQATSSAGFTRPPSAIGNLPKPKDNSMIIVVIVLLVIIGGGWMYNESQKKKMSAINFF